MTLDTTDWDDEEKILFNMELDGRNYMRKPIIKKLQEIIKLGHVPCRGDEYYGKFGGYVNCFEHACFNLTNKQIESLCLDDWRLSFRSPFGEFDENSIEKSREEMFHFVTQTGLKVEKGLPTKILKSNQYQVALYFSKIVNRDIIDDFHFLLQEKDGTWSGKCGDMSTNVEHFDSLETVLPHTTISKYVLDNVFTITNPYASEKQSKSVPLTILDKDKNLDKPQIFLGR